MKSLFKRFTKAGPGGMKCPCCGGRMKKHVLFRIAKRKARRDDEQQTRL